jgi:16S rRNA (cytosine967-C5)-methyltransferase
VKQPYSKPPGSTNRAPSPKGPPKDPARHAAFSRLAHLAGQFPNLPIGNPDTGRLNDLDAAFVHAIVDAAVGRWLTLEAVLSSCTDKPFAEFEQGLKGVLLGAGAQLLFLDKVPAHAVLDTAVEWAKTNVRPGAAGLVNALLRNLVEAIESKSETPWKGEREAIPEATGGSVRFKKPMLHEDEVRRLAQATSCPWWLVHRWTNAFGAPEARRLAMHGLCDPPTILNMAYTTGEAVDNPLLTLTAHDSPMHWVVEGKRTALAELLEKRRDIWVQDPASTASLLGIGALAKKGKFSPRLIIDLCAGQGTKTRQLLAEFPGARVVATDTDPRRLDTLAAAFKDEPRVRVASMADVARENSETADLVLLDVPCSNSGVLARRLEARYRFESDQMTRLIALQREIIGNSLRLLKRSGEAWIVYSTCSIEAEEDEKQVEALASAGFRTLKSERVMPQAVPGDAASRYSDGSYAAVLRRK